MSEPTVSTTDPGQTPVLAALMRVRARGLLALEVTLDEATPKSATNTINPTSTTKPETVHLQLLLSEDHSRDESGAADHDDFYRRTDIKACYRAYVKHFLGRRNRYTGLRYHDEPTVMTWELANEPRCRSDKSGDTLIAWADEMSRYVKRHAPRQLVAVGDEGFFGRAGDPDYPYSDYEGVSRDGWSR